MPIVLPAYYSFNTRQLIFPRAGFIPVLGTPHGKTANFGCIKL